MTTIQDKFFRQLDLAVRRTKHELVTRSDWANTGSGSLQKRTGFGVASEFSYNFQSGYATFTVNGKKLYATYAKADRREQVTLDDVIAEIVKVQR